MTKPWEEEIVVEAGDGHANHRNDRHLYAAREGAEGEWIGVVGSEAPGGAAPWAKLFQAAPLLVRALGTSGALKPDDDQWHLIGCDGLRGLVECVRECQDARAALKAAGWTP